jgi:uncharacterized C2H2 Zn-finger protein
VPYPTSILKEAGEMSQCGQCLRWFNTTKSLWQHIEATGHSFDCPVCHDMFAEEDELDSHRHITGHWKAWACDNCPKRFGSENECINHMNQTGHWEFYCSSCKVALTNANDLRMVRKSRYRKANANC